MKHALFIAFHYPPEASSSGVLRTLKYTRYLVDYGWRTTVIAPSVDAYSTVDRELEKQIPASTRVIRTGFLNTKRHLSIRGLYPSILALPDRWIGWLPWGISAGKRLVSSDPFDVVYSTSPHATAHLIAWRIAKLAARPWVADFRDPWIEDPPEPGTPQGRIYTAVNRWLERKVVENASAIVTSTHSLRAELASRHVKRDSATISAILNGYDEADFKDLSVHKDLSPQRTPANEELVVLHAGSINGSFRNPIPLFKAARACANDGTIDLARVRFRFLGAGEYASSAEIACALDSLNLRGAVEFLPRVAYSRSLAAFSESDVLLLLQASADTTGLVPAKLYEYLRAGKPVLALVHPGATEEVLSLVGGGWSVVPEHEDSLKRVLVEIFGRWKSRELDRIRAHPTALRQFERRLLTGELAALFERLVATIRKPGNAVSELQSSTAPKA